MSIVNLVVTHSRAVIVTDSATFSAYTGERTGVCSKAIAYQLQRFVCAGAGQSFLIDAWKRHLIGAGEIVDIDAANAVAPNWLARGWNETASDLRRYLAYDAQSTTIYLVGISPRLGGIVGYQYRSTTGFASERLSEDCTYLMPGIETKTSADESSAEELATGAASSAVEEPPLTSAERWHSLLRLATMAPKQQHRESSQVGGRIHCTYIDEGGFISINSPYDLDEEEPIEPLTGEA